MCTGLILGNAALSFWVQNTMRETFKWNKILVFESQKDGLQIPVKVSLGKRFQSTLKMQIFNPMSSIFSLPISMHKHAPHSLTYIKLK